MSKSQADQNMIVCNTEEAAEVLQIAFAAKRPVMLWGSPGIGKSGLLKTIATESGRGMIDYRLLLKDLSDLKGVPYYNTNKGHIEYAYDPHLPNAATDPNDNRILVFEELNAAPPTIQAATYQIILDRFCGDMKIPDGVDIVACGNLETDKGVTYNMPTPLRNRLLHVLIEPDVKAWETWAFKNKIHKNVLAYVISNKSKLYQFEASSGEKAFATPRTWEMTSDLLYSADERGKGSDRAILKSIVASAIGEGNAIEFLRYIEVSMKLPSAEDIISGKVKKLPKNLDDISAHYALGVELIYAFDQLTKEREKLREDNGEKKMLNDEFENMFNFIESEFTEELIYLTLQKMLVEGQVVDYIDLDGSVASFDRFMKKYTYLITS